MNRKKLILTSLPLILIVIALVAGFIFFPQSFDLRNKASSVRPTVAPRPEGTAQMLMIQETTKVEQPVQTFDVYFNGAYKPDAQISSFETQITVRSENGQVLGESDSLAQAESQPLDVGLVVTNAPAPITGSIQPSRAPTVAQKTSNIKCNPGSDSCGYGSKCVSTSESCRPGDARCTVSQPRIQQCAPEDSECRQRMMAIQPSPTMTVYYCSMPNYCFNKVVTEASGRLVWTGCKNATGDACAAVITPLNATETELYNSWVSAGRPANAVCGTSTAPTTTPTTVAAAPITIWSEGNAKLTTTEDIQSKLDLIVTATKSSDGMSYVLTIKGTPKVGAAVSGQNLKLATLTYDTQKFSRKINAGITQRSILAMTPQSTTPIQLITTPTSTTPPPPTTTQNPTCGIGSVQPLTNTSCSSSTYTAANVTCTNGRSTQLKTSVCSDYAQFKSMGYSFCQSACGSTTSTPSPSISIKPSYTPTPTPCIPTSYSGPSNMATCDGGIAGTFRSFTVNCSDGYKQVMNASSLDQCWSSTQMAQVGASICGKRSTCPVVTVTPSPISMTPPTGIRCTGQCIISGDGTADPYGTTYPVGRTCYGIDRLCYVCGSNGQFTVSQTACATIPTPNPTTNPTIIATVTPTATPTPCAPTPKCDGQLIHGDPRPGSGYTCPVYQCIPTPTPVCPPWNLLCRIVSTPTPKPTTVTPTPCPSAPTCRGQLIVGDPLPGAATSCPVYQCIPTPTPTPTCAPWNLFCRIRPTSTPTACPQNYSPVCGTDGRTYSNSCMASQAKVSVAHSGPCGSRPTPTPNRCPWWNLGCRVSRPSVTPTPSITTPTPQVTRTGGGGVACAALYAPVCSTDNVTYGNECEARVAGATVAYNGACAVPAQQ